VAELRGQYLLLLFGRDKARNVDKCQKHTVNLIVRNAVRKDTNEIITASADMADRAFRHLLSGENPTHILVQVRIIDAADDIGQRPAAVAGDQVEQLGDRRCKTANLQKGLCTRVRCV